MQLNPIQNLTASSNRQATCLITTLDASYGWFEVAEGEWIYDPTASTVNPRPTLGAHFESNLFPCVEQDRSRLLNALISNPESSANVKDDGVIECLKTLDWPAVSPGPKSRSTFLSRFPLKDQYIAGLEWFSGYYLGGGLVATAGHCLKKHLQAKTLSSLQVVFGWYGALNKRQFHCGSDIFDIEK